MLLAFSQAFPTQKLKLYMQEKQNNTNLDIKVKAVNLPWLENKKQQ